MDYGSSLRGCALDRLCAWRRRQGLIKGAIVGGIAGHMAGHGKVGAAAGCAIGHHEANKQNPNNSNAQAPAQQK